MTDSWFRAIIVGAIAAMAYFLPFEAFVVTMLALIFFNQIFYAGDRP